MKKNEKIEKEEEEEDLNHAEIQNEFSENFDENSNNNTKPLFNVLKNEFGGTNFQYFLPSEIYSIVNEKERNDKKMETMNKSKILFGESREINKSQSKYKDPTADLYHCVDIWDDEKESKLFLIIISTKKFMIIC